MLPFQAIRQTYIIYLTQWLFLSTTGLRYNVNVYSYSARHKYIVYIQIINLRAGHKASIYTDNNVYL